MARVPRLRHNCQEEGSKCIECKSGRLLLGSASCLFGKLLLAWICKLLASEPGLGRLWLEVPLAQTVWE